MKNFILFGFLIVSSLAHGQFSSSSLNSACKKDGFSCGECESDLQNDLNMLLNKITNGGFGKAEHWGDIKEKSKDPANISMAPGVTLDKTLQAIIELFKKNNPVGDNKLNFVVIGESESLQGSSIKNGKMYPRIMLKSPNSELMVTFNTDPKAKGHNTIEMMRWNGKKARYEFQELNFGKKGKRPHVDATGTKCMECHKESPRPNWDTYRAWAGVVPSRDDMMEMHGENGQFDKAKGMQPDAKAYLNFLDQVASDKDRGVKSRIAMLDIPFDEKRQMGEYVKATGKKGLTSREKVDLIKKKIEDTGFYRIKHFPDIDEARYGNARMSFNFDQKTARWAGPSQFAFDQMLAQNMCKVTTDLTKHKDFETFKYPLAFMMSCGAFMDKVYPQSFKDEVVKFYNDSKLSGLQDIDPSKRPKKVSSFDEMNQLLFEDTKASHDHANGFKYNRHEKFLTNFLTNVERQPAGQAAEQAKFYSEQVKTPTHMNFHAIKDVGGVTGVPEASTEVIANARILLEKFGVKVGHWSLVHGKSNAYNSFSFSDQFQLFQSQPIWRDIANEAGGCFELEMKAKAALAIPESKLPRAAPASDNTSEIALLCGQQEKGVQSPLDQAVIGPIQDVLVKQMKADMKKSMIKCLTCHDTDGDVEFPGLAKFVRTDDEKTFREYLNSESDYFKRPIIEVVQIKLGVLSRPEGDGLEYGDEMPPSSWKDNADYAKKHGISPDHAQEQRRKQLATFLTIVAGQDNKERLKSFCEKINNDSYIKDFASPKSKGSKPAQAGQQ